MKFKMTKMTHKQIDEVNKLLETYGDSLTAFYDEAFWLGVKQGIICGALFGLLACIGCSACWAVKCFKAEYHEDEEE